MREMLANHKEDGSKNRQLEVSDNETGLIVGGKMDSKAWAPAALSDFSPVIRMSQLM